MAPTQLEIKSKALARLIKEEGLYQKELKEQEEHVQGLKSSNADSYEIKKQEEVLEDTRKVIPEVRKKISEAQESLESYITDYTGTEDLTTAKKNIEAAKKLLG